MKPTLIPTFCSAALVAMCTAGLEHWWSLRQFANLQTEVARTLPTNFPLTPAITAPKELVQTIASTQPQPETVTAPQKEFFEALLAEVKKLRNENLNLVDQMAETNRDLMKLEFRVDTHSESFRPLPVSQERSDTSLDGGPGVLPPRAEPVFPLSNE